MKKSIKLFTFLLMACILSTGCKKYTTPDWLQSFISSLNTNCKNYVKQEPLSYFDLDVSAEYSPHLDHLDFTITKVKDKSAGTDWYNSERFVKDVTLYVLIKTFADLPEDQQKEFKKEFKKMVNDNPYFRIQIANGPYIMDHQIVELLDTPAYYVLERLENDMLLDYVLETINSVSSDGMKGGYFLNYALSGEESYNNSIDLKMSMALPEEEIKQLAAKYGVAPTEAALAQYFSDDNHWEAARDSFGDYVSQALNNYVMPKIKFEWIKRFKCSNITICLGESSFSIPLAAIMPEKEESSDKKEM